MADIRAEMRSKSTVHASIRQTNPANVSGNVNVSGAAGPKQHSQLYGRDAPDQHPMSSISGLIAALGKKPDGMEVTAEGLVYLTSGGERIAGPYGPFGSGGGSGNGATTLELINTTGWLFNRVAAGRPCVLTASWSSTRDNIPTGPGTLQIFVSDTPKSMMSVEQGDVNVDVAGWLSNGANTVKLVVTDAYQNTAELIYTIEVVSVSVKSNFDGNVVCTGPTHYYYTPIGAAVKTVYFLLDGAEIGKETVTVSNQQQDFIIPAQTHGSHTFEVYFTAKIGETDVESNHLYYDLIFVEEGRTETIIASVFRPVTMEQFDTFVIPYRVYNPLSLTANVVLAEGDTDLKELIVDRTEQQWSHRIDEVGDIELSIASGGAVKRFAVTVVESSVKVTPVTNNLVLDLSSYGRSNLEPNPLTWESNGIECGFSGFNLKSDGWVLDDDGVTVMRVGGDARITVPLKIFETDFRTTGKTIEIEFATRNVVDYNAMLLTCWSGCRGITIDAQKALFKSAQSEVSVPYKEEEHIRIAFTIEKRTGNRLILVYVNGIMSGAVQYPSDDDFAQTEPTGITIGSSDCTMDIYHIRVYDNDLTRQQVLNNWIADTQIGALRKERYSRNQVYDDYGRITTETISKDLSYLILRSPVLPQYKGDKKTINDQLVDPVDSERGYTSEGTEIDVQGTSSQYYYRKNYKLKYKKGFIKGTTVVEVYAMNDDAVPVAVFTMKADVASSEGYYNVCSARLFNRFHPFKMPAQVTDPRTRYSIDGFPIAIFWDNGDETVFLGKYNFNNDKGTPEPFGLSGKDERWEVLQNGTPLVGFHSADFSGNWEEDLEGNYPDGNTDLTNLKPMWEWVASTKGNPDKFGSELSLYFVPEAADYYMIFTEALLCMDQREKNVLWRFIDAIKKWLADYYDADSIIGHNNQAQPVFDYWMEDIDYTADGEPVYNGQNSVFWKNMRAARATELKAEWHRLRDAGFSYETVIEEFRKHKEHWCEAVYNEDMQIKCLDPLLNSGDGTYLPFLRGDKWAWTQWWLHKRFRYLDSKYEYGDSLINMTTIRTNVMRNMVVTYFMKMYGHVRYNAESVEIRVEKDIPYEFVSKAAGAEDRVIGLPDSDMITDIGDMSEHMVELIDTSKLTRLVRLKLGSDAEGYVNRSLTNLTLGNNKLLRYLDVRNCQNLTQSVDASGCIGLEEVYFDGTAITGLGLPNGGNLRVLHLPETITNLTIRNQAKLEEFIVPSYENVSTLWLEGISGAIDPSSILAQMSDGGRARIIGFNSEFETAEEFDAFIAKLDSMRGLDEIGNNVDVAQIVGGVHAASISFGLYTRLNSLNERYPNLDISYDEVEPAMTYKLLTRTLDGVYTNDRITTIGKRAFSNCVSLEGIRCANVNHVGDCGLYVDLLYDKTARTIDLPELISGDERAFAGDRYVSILNVPKLETISKYMFEGTFRSSPPSVIDFPSVTKVDAYGFMNAMYFAASKTMTIRFRKNVNINAYAFGNVPSNTIVLVLDSESICTTGYTGSCFAYIYVPRSLVDSYKVSTNWSIHADKFRALEDYTVDGTTTGELDESKV